MQVGIGDNFPLFKLRFIFTKKQQKESATFMCVEKSAKNLIAFLQYLLY